MIAQITHAYVCHLHGLDELTGKPPDSPQEQPLMRSLDIRGPLYLHELT